jgi:predicted nuclease with TOPRIM domain
LRKSELGVFKAQIGPVKQKINNVTEAIAEMGHSHALLRRLENLETELHNLNLRIRELETDQNLPENFPDPDEISKRIKTVLTNASLEDKKIILQGLVHRIDAQRIKEKGIVRGTITYILPSSIGGKQKAPREEEPSENIYVYDKCPHGDSNPGFSLERAMS